MNFPFLNNRLAVFIDVGFIKRLCALKPCLVSGFFPLIFMGSKNLLVSF